MAKSLQELLGYTTLTGLIQATVPGVPDVLPPSFDSFSKNVLMDRGEYTKRTGNRGVARRQKFGAPPVKRNLRDISTQGVILAHFIEEQEYNAQQLMTLRKYDSYEQDQQYEEVRSQVAYFNDYFDNLQKTIKLKTLKSPTLYFDADGNLLPDSSGSDSSQTITLYTQDSGHTAQLNFNSEGNIIDASWASAATDIPGHVRRLKQAARADTGYPVKYAIYGKNIPSYMTANNMVRDYLARDGSGRGEWLKDNEIGNLFGLEWVPGYEAFWRSGDTQDTVNYVLDDDEVIFTPEPSRNWWERLDGSYWVPTNINLVADAEAALNNLKLVNGKFAYAQVTTRPVGFVVTCGTTFLYVLKVPDAVWDATVAF